jgi:hypothetical protein
MKKLTLLIAILLVVGFSANAFAQVSASASTTATIVAPITIGKTVDMNFGNVLVDATAGTVILATDNSRTRTGGATLPPTTGTVTAASFHVTGSGSLTYSITLPAAPITLAGGSANVTVGTFVSDPTPTGTLTAGAQDVLVGATLNLPAGGVTAGSYTNAAGLTVTVNYN